VILFSLNVYFWGVSTPKTPSSYGVASLCQIDLTS